MLFLLLMLFSLLCYWCYSFRRFCLTAAAILMILLTRVGIVVATAKLLLLQLLSFPLIVILLLFAAIIVSTAKILLRQLL